MGQRVQIVTPQGAAAQTVPVADGNNGYTWGSSSGATTRTGIAALGVGPSAYTGAGATVETAERRLITLPVNTTQWRLRLSNYSDYSESAGAGTIQVAGVYLGAPSYPIAGGRWIGDCAAAPTLLDSGETLTLSAFGDCYVSPWITTTGEQFVRGVPQVLTLGLVSGSGAATLAYVEPGGAGNSGDAFFTSGAGTSATAANAAAPASQIQRQFLDWRIEYQYLAVNGDTPNILVIGDSIAAGYVCTENPYADFAMVHENWPMAAAIRNRISLFNGGIGGAGLSRTAGGGAFDPAFVSPQTSWRWQRTGLQRTAGSTVAPSGPTPFAWYDASQITSPPANGSPLASWNDLSGNARTITQGTGGSQPTYATNQQNGLAVVQFGSGQSMANASVPNWNPAFTVIAAMNFGTAGGNLYYIEGSGAGSGLGRSNGKMLIEPGVTVSTLSPIGTSFGVATWQQSIAASQATLRYNGGGLSLSPSISSASWTEIILNGASTGTVVGEVVIFNSVLTPAQTRAWEMYLTAKWMPPPLYSNPPAVTYDKAIIALGANDLNGGQTLAEMEASFPNIVGYLQEQGIQDIYATTVIPWDFASATETLREQYNTWLRTLPAGIVGVIDLDKEISLPPTMVYTTATLTSGAGGNPVTVASGAGIVNGMTCVAVGGGSDGGPIPPSTTVTNVAGTSITLSNNPGGSGAYTLLFTAPAGIADPDLLFDPPHPTRGGYQRMASAVVLQ